MFPNLFKRPAPQKQPLFAPGSLKLSEKVHWLARKGLIDPLTYVQRHVRGDWGEMPTGQGTRRWTQRLLRGPQVRVQRRPEALQPANLVGELRGLHRHAEEMLRLGRTGGDDVRQERPLARQFLGFDFAKPNLQQQIAHGLDATTRTCGSTERWKRSSSRW